MSETFCILPWMHLATNAQGHLRVCCNSTPSKNVILKEDGSPYTIYNDDLKEAWNSHDYQKIRFEFLNSKRPDMCQRCFSEEDAGVKSARQFSNEKWGLEGVFLPYTEFNVRYGSGSFFDNLGDNLIYDDFTFLINYERSIYQSLLVFLF